MTQDRCRKIVICGGGLVGQLCAAALMNTLADDIEITLIETPDSGATDAFFGTVTSPAIYDFFLRLGVSEPDLLLQTETAFSLGTVYSGWTEKTRTWLQGFHSPLPVQQGVGFHHYVVRHDQPAKTSPLAPYIMSAQAAARNVFAHPPEDRKSPLSTLRYGYHFQPEDWTRFLSERNTRTPLLVLKADIEQVSRLGETVTSISLSEGRTVEADLFIDCGGQAFPLLERGRETWEGGRHLKLASRQDDPGKQSTVYRKTAATSFGWMSETSLQDRILKQTVYDPASEAEALVAFGEVEGMPIEIKVGRSRTPWKGNILTLGHVAAALEPTTVAPMLMLQKDIERLIELVPVASDMSVEAKEYNRRFQADYHHAELFQRALTSRSGPHDTPYWKSAQARPVHQDLKTKLTQFDSRGVLVQFDLEPFGPQDWAMLHFGMGRWPTRYDPLADRVDLAAIEHMLDRLKIANAKMVGKMPPHDIYMSGLLKYLRDKHG